MPVTVPPRAIGNSLQNRQARPLNGAEVRESIENHLMTLAIKLLSNAGLLSDQITELSENLKNATKLTLSRQQRLQKVHLTYPKVGWSVKIRLEQLDDASYSISAEVELDLERGIRLNIPIGQSGVGIVMGSLEDEKIPTAVPDRDRSTFGLPITAEYTKVDGTTGTVDIRELRRSARTIDVGSGADNRESRQVPTDEDGKIATKEILMAGIGQGNEIVTPDQLPEISLETVEVSINDVVATLPQVDKEPLRAPLPPKGVSATGRPAVKFKETK